MKTSTRRDFLKTSLGVSGLLFGGFRCHAGQSFEIGRPYSGWQTGELDIHVIYTGRGESLFHIFPDGTSMLIDAGDHELRGHGPMPNLPDTSRRAGEWVARYIQRVNPAESHVDYVMLSHFHPDHGGKEGPGVEMTTGRGEDYALSGLAQAGEFLQFDYGFDRGYPDYAFPTPDLNPTGENFRKFTSWAMKEKGLKMEKFEPGVLDQIRLQKDPSYDFHIRNLSANGVVWTGKGTDTHNFLPDYKEKNAKENPLSLSLTIQYGRFRYYTGGDLDTAIPDETGKPVPIEAAAGLAAGRVDVCKANHHVSNNACTDEFVQAVQARAYLSTVWVDGQPGMEASARLLSRENYPGKRRFFPQLISEKRLAAIAEAPWRGEVATDGGHVVLKVFDSGRQYKIYYLTAEDESMTVKALYGPYPSTGAIRDAAYRENV
ncbi:MAG: hypothetical protein IJG60_04370 [Thermoguttaceae bacterium]|nr:hypothetical protein [Thermoguttaceae bacterium]